MGLILIFQFVLFLSNPDTKYCAKITQFFNNYLNISDFSQIALILGLVIVCVYVFKNIYMLIFTCFNNNILQDLSVKITSKIMKNLLFGDYLTTCNISKEQKINILSKVNFVVWQYCYKYINLIINLSIALILISYLFIKFTLSALLACVFISALAFFEYKYLKKNSTYQNKHFSLCFDEFNSLLLRIISSIKEIKLNNKSDDFIEQVENKSLDLALLNKNRSFCEVFHVYFTEISIMLAFAMVLGCLFYTVNFDNQLLIGSICAICVIILRLSPLINRIQSCLYAINSNKSIVSELLEFDEKFKNTNFTSDKEKLNFKDSFEFKDVNFSYNDKKEGLKNINFKIKKGEFIGIIAKSGGYKTTLSLIISGLIKPQTGEILVDNKILNQNDHQKWSNNIALMSQDYSLLFENIDNIEQKYIEKLNLKQTKNLSHLSCGERQRAAFANILAKDKDILILDEITSSQDVIKEDAISDILNDLKQNKTLIVISHRLNVLKNCDRIIYMDKGQIVDIDGFLNLSEKYPDFKKIVELSSLRI